MFAFSRRNLARFGVAVSVSLCTLSWPVAAQTPQSIVVTGSRAPTPLLQATSDVLVIDEAALRNAQGRTVEDVLREVAGLQFARNGAPGQSVGVFIRGSASNNTVVLIDGVRVGSATLGQMAFEGLSLAQIERIEVLRGPGSSLYGADAVGGVVQIFTKRGVGEWQGQAAWSQGGKGSSAVQASVSGRSGAIDAAISLGREASDGVSAVAVPGGAFGSYNPDADGFVRNSGAAQLGLAIGPDHRVGLSATRSRLNARYDGVDFPPPTFAPDASGDYRNRQRTQTVALSHSAQWTQQWRSELTLSDQDDDATSGLATPDRFTTQRRQLSWQHTVNLAPQTQAVAFVEGLNTHAQIESSFANYTNQRRNRALGLVGSTAVGQTQAHRFQLDVRRDSNSAYGAHTTARVGYSVALQPALTLRAAAGSAFRAPSFNETDYPGYGVVGIQPERARSAEVGARWQAAGMELAGTLYRNQVRNLIGYEGDPAACPVGYDFGCAANIGRAVLKGASFNGQGRWGAWRWQAAVDFLDARDADTGEQLARRARHTEHLTLGYDVASWGAELGVQGVGARWDGGSRLGAYELLDLSARWRFAPQWQAQARLLNALDRRYEPLKDYGALGRQFWLGVRFDSQGL
jgi:vitamin B12 transporter